MLDDERPTRHYRDRADECLALAARWRSSALAARFRAMAERYRGLAEQRQTTEETKPGQRTAPQG